MAQPFFLLVEAFEKKCLLGIKAVPVLDNEPSRPVSAFPIELLNQKTFKVFNLHWKRIRASFVDK